MGFRDLKVFKFALLVKQGWRIIRQIESFLARCLQAKYYPNSKFLTATLGNQVSYVWRSI